jgi:hypothetical protein
MRGTTTLVGGRCLCHRVEIHRGQAFGLLGPSGILVPELGTALLALAAPGGLSGYVALRGPNPGLEVLSIRGTDVGGRIAPRWERSGL